MTTIPPRPKPGSLTDHALLQLLRGQRISHRDHYRETASYRLASVIHQLRKQGWVIDSMPEVGRTSTGRITHYVRYRIPELTLRRYLANANVRRWTGGRS
jgi:hypothetical protein